MFPHWLRKDRLLKPEQEADNAVHCRVRPRVEYVLFRMRTYKILRDCRLPGDGVYQAITGIARLHNLARGQSVHHPFGSTLKRFSESS